jgi:hypothetical protein
MRLAPLFILHNFKQLHSTEFEEILMSASNNWHIFTNTNDHVYERLANYIEPTFSPESAMKATPRFSYIASWLDSFGEYQTPFIVKAPDLVWNRYKTEDNRRLTEEHSKLYGVRAEDVEREIQNRMYRR